MAKRERTYIPIIAAFMGLFGVLGTAVISNWHKLFPADDSGFVAGYPGDVSPTPNDVDPNKPAWLILEEDQTEAESIAREWLLAYNRHNLTELEELTKPPFFCFDEKLESSIEIVQRFRKLFIEEGKQEDLEVHKSYKILDCFLWAHGKTESDGKPLPALEQMQLKDDDIAVVCWTSSSISRYFKWATKDFAIGLPSPLPSGTVVILYFRRVDDGVQLVSYYSYGS